MKILRKLFSSPKKEALKHAGKIALVIGSGIVGSEIGTRVGAKSSSTEEKEEARKKELENLKERLDLAKEEKRDRAQRLKDKSLDEDEKDFIKMDKPHLDRDIKQLRGMIDETKNTKDLSKFERQTKKANRLGTAGLYLGMAAAGGGLLLHRKFKKH